MAFTTLDPKYLFRHSGRATPELGLVQSFWALTEREKTLEQALEVACDEGYKYFEAGLLEDRLVQISSLLHRFPLQLIAQGWAVTADEATPFFDRALGLGAVALNLHLGHAFMSVEDSVDLLSRVQDDAEKYGIPLLIETHRGRFTQDLFRTHQLLSHRPRTILTLDLSHYVVAGEGMGGSPKHFEEHIRPLLARTALIHGRISNGQSIQVPTDDAFALTADHQSVWRQAMQMWLADAPPDAVFLFEPELGPPPYAYLQRDGTETFCRAEASRTLASLALQAWSDAKTSIASQLEGAL